MFKICVDEAALRFVNLSTPGSRVGISLGFTLLVVAYHLFYVFQLKQIELEEGQKELARLKVELSMNEFANAQLRAQVKYLATDAGAEDVAREKLGLIKPGEMAFVVVGGSPPQPAPPPEVALEEVRPSLVQRFMHWLFIG